MLPLKKYVILFFAVLLAQFFKAQATPVNPLDKNYTPDENSPWYSGRSASRKNKATGPAEDIIYAIKWMPFELMRGNLVFENEVNIYNAVNATFGIGYNILNDAIARSSNSGALADVFDLDSDGGTLSARQIINNSQYMHGGIFFSAGFKNYYSGYGNSNGFFSNVDGDPFNGFYSLFRLSYYTNTYRLPGSFENYVISSPDGQIKIKNYLINVGFGYSFTTNGKTKTVHDFYIGFGLKASSFPAYVLSEAPVQGNSSTVQYQYAKKGNENNLNFGAFTIGYSLGLGF